MSDHYFTARPETAHRPGQVHVLLPDVHLELDTDAGVFSPGRLDTGTRLLLDVDTKPPAPQPATCSTWAAGTGRSHWCWRPARRPRRSGRWT